MKRKFKEVSEYMLVIVTLVIFVIGLNTILDFVAENFFKEEFVRYETSFRINKANIVWIDDPVKVGRQLQIYNENRGYDINKKWTLGLAEPNENGNCIIWAYEPKGAWDEEYLKILGHEMFHCFRGSFHD